MLLRELICEDYKTAAVKFNAVADPNQVQQVIAQYRQLVNKNQVQGNERNIDWWAGQGGINSVNLFNQNLQPPLLLR